MEENKPVGTSSSLQQHALERDEAAGVNPISIVTGVGIKGEKMRHVVHEGALRLPKSALDIMGPTLNSQAVFQLPGIDSVARPSRDSSVTNMTVTEIHGVMLPADPANMLPERLQCYSRNRQWPVETPNAAPERLRGGGLEGEVGGGDDSRPNEPSATHLSETQPMVLETSPTEQDKVSVASDVQAVQPSANNPAIGTTEQLETELPVVPAPPQWNPAIIPPAGPASDVMPASVSSAGPTPASSRPLPEVVPLASQPEAQWQQHAPNQHDSAQPETESNAPTPEWFKLQEVSDLERSLLSEWFDGSALHRNEKSYLASRNRMVDMSNKLKNRNVTTTMIRRSIPGDVGSLMRLYSFLSGYGLINTNALNDTAPTPVNLQESKAKYRWSEPLQQELLHAVVEESRKRRKVKDLPTNMFEPVVDWEAVAAKVGHGVSSTDCERQFLAMPIADASAERAITPDAAVTNGPDQSKGKESHDDSAKAKIRNRQELLQDIVERSDSNVIHAIVDAALLVSQAENPDRAQQNAQAGVMGYQGLMEAKSREDKVSRIMAEVVDLRMNKLENRMSMLDDVEGLLEGERAALELERRDLYTARCRHWFGGA